MKEIYRHKDHSTVAYYKSILESEGIPTMLRNEHTTMAGLSEIPIPEFYPNICVMNDEDYPRAWEIMKRTMETNSKDAEVEVTCAICGESNPGNFDICFSCGEDMGSAE
ncbi:MAG: DUF2007 domain-containing protein [Akkermansiaceae bacterium]|nr:DUF2007 domain-containing protein [Akkermansiaceae bacterium]